MKTIYHSFFLSTLLIFTSCALFKKKYMPPSDEFIANIQKNLENDSNPLETDPSLSEIWSIMYMEAKHYMAKSDRQRACYLMKTLGDTDDFPLNDLAQIHAMTSCISKKSEIISFKDKESSIPSWYKQDYFYAALKTSRNLNDRGNQGYFALSLSRLEKNQDKKIALLEEALKNGAEEIKNEALSSLSKLLPSKYKIEDPNLSPQEQAKNFARNREFKEARKIYKTLMNDANTSFDTRLGIWELYRNSYKLERNDSQFIKETNNMLRFIDSFKKKDPDNEQYSSAFNNLTVKKARVYWTKNDAKEARRILASLFKIKDVSPRLLSEAYYILGRMDIEIKNYKSAQEQFLKAVEYEYRDDDFRERLTWQIAWTYYYNLKDYKRAEEFFQTLVDDTANSSFKFQYLYWLALAQKKLGNTKEAEEILSDLAREDAYGFYGIMAHRELKRPLKPLTSDIETKYIPEIFAWLLAMDEKESALSYLNSYMYRISRQGPIMDHLSLYTKVEGAGDGISQFYRLTPQNRDYVIENMSHIAYPRPFRDLVTENSQKTQVSEEMIYSIMRQESVFNPVIKSPADAYGLMQLIPETAASMAKKYNVSSYKSYDDLYYPEINIQLGARYLSTLKEKFHHFAMATASYNAGETAVSNWKKLYYTKGENSDIEFIELIPYAETQKYVKLVLRNYINYLRSQAKEELPFPDEFFTEKF